MMKINFSKSVLATSLLLLLTSAMSHAQTETCKFLRERGVYHAYVGNWTFANDTLRLFIENCANDSSSAAEFYKITGSVLEMDTAPERWDNCREWLKKVLFYNTNDWRYYCGDIQAILLTYYYKNHDLLAEMAISKYISETNRCPGWSFADSFSVDLPKVYEEVYKEWLDTAKDTVNTKPDSTLPTLEKLGLNVVKDHSKVIEGSANNQEVSDVAVATNPFSDYLVITYTITEGAALQIGIFDDLGRTILSKNLRWNNIGKHSLRLSGQGLRSGTYYARLETLHGEIHTLKLIKE